MRTIENRVGYVWGMLVSALGVCSWSLWSRVGTPKGPCTQYLGTWGVG